MSDNSMKVNQMTKHMADTAIFICNTVFIGTIASRGYC